MRVDFRLLALIPLVAVLASGCASQRVKVDRAPLGVQRYRVHYGETGPLQASWRLEDGVLIGKVLPRKACRDVVVRKERITTTQYRKDPANRLRVFMLLAGTTLAGAGVWALAEAPNHTGEETCNTDEDGEESCHSVSSDYALGGVAGLGFGGWFIYHGRGALGSREEHEISSKTRTNADRQVGQSSVSCADTAQLEGLVLTGTFGNHKLRGKVDASGTVSIPLPTPSPGASEAIEIAVASVPDDLEKAIPVGTPAGTANVEPWIAYWRKAAARALAKRQAEKREAIAKAERSLDWDGRLFGDTNLGELTRTCTATGTEACFDAIDNDCDGLYDDVDCGYQSGSVQWTLAWKGAPDLDLHVLGPDGVEVFWRNRSSEASKLELDRDCKGLVDGSPDCPQGNIENIYVPRNEAPMPGTYIAWVEVYDLHGQEAPEGIPITVGGRIGGKTWHQRVVLAGTKGAVHRIAFANGSDSDGDGIVDGNDACPDEPGRWASEATARGCPDGDLDGVPDKVDACPSEPGLTQVVPSKNGCPIKFKHAWVTNAGVTFLKNVEFDVNRATIRPSSRAVLRDVARAIRARPGMARRLAVEGHTDDDGEEAANWRLSLERARAVASYLTQHEGIPASRLVARGYGEHRPKKPNTTARNKQENRRVEIVVLEPRSEAAQRW